jgi:hypothetical protein
MSVKQENRGEIEGKLSDRLIKLDGHRHKNKEELFIDSTHIAEIIFYRTKLLVCVFSPFVWRNKKKVVKR